MRVKVKLMRIPVFSLLAQKINNFFEELPDRTPNIEDEEQMDYLRQWREEHHYKSKDKV